MCQTSAAAHDASMTAVSSKSFGCEAKLAPEGWPEEQTEPVKAFDSDFRGDREFKDEAAPPPIFFSVF